MRPKVLLYHLGEDSDTGCRLRDILREKKLLILTAEETHLSQTVGELVSGNTLPSGDGAAGAAPDASFALLCGLGDRQLDRLLAAMRRNGVHVPYKAVLTEHNRDWTLGQLIDAVVQEHDMMRQKRGD